MHLWYVYSEIIQWFILGFYFVIIFTNRLIDFQVHNVLLTLHVLAFLSSADIFKIDFFTKFFQKETAELKKIYTEWLIMSCKRWEYGIKTQMRIWHFISSDTYKLQGLKNTIPVDFHNKHAKCFLPKEKHLFGNANLGPLSGMYIMNHPKLYQFIIIQYSKGN